MKRLVNIGLGRDMVANMNIPINSASAVSFISQNVLQESKLVYFPMGGRENYREPSSFWPN